MFNKIGSFPVNCLCLIIFGILFPVMLFASVDLITIVTPSESSTQHCEITIIAETKGGPALADLYYHFGGGLNFIGSPDATAQLPDGYWNEGYDGEDDGQRYFWYWDSTPFVTYNTNVHFYVTAAGQTDDIRITVDNRCEKPTLNTPADDWEFPCGTSIFEFEWQSANIICCDYVFKFLAKNRITGAWETVFEVEKGQDDSYIYDYYNLTLDSDNEYGWTVGTINDIGGYDYSGAETRNFTLAPPITTSGTITADQTWPCSGSTVIVDDNLTVASGATLTINSGTTVKVDFGKSITINGALNANGVTFTTNSSAKWSGIQFSSNGSANLQNCTFQYANTAITKSNGGNNVYIYGCTFQNNDSNIEGYSNSDDLDLQIKNSTLKYAQSEDCIYLNNSGANIENNTINGQYHDSDGIYVWQFDNQSNLKIKNNNIYDCNKGIYFYQSSGDVQSNDIYSNQSVAIVAYNGSAPQLSYNEITNNTYGISNSSNSDIDLDYGNNTISSNYYNLSNLNSITLYARNNYWGASPPDGSKINGSVVYNPYLNSSPTTTERFPSDESYIAKAASSGEMVFGVADAPILVQYDPVLYSLFENAIVLERVKDYHAAIAQFKKVIKRNPDHSLAVSAFYHLVRSNNKLDKNITSAVVQDILNDFSKSNVAAWAMKFKVSEFLRAGKPREALFMSEKIVEEFPELSVSKDAVFDQWVIHYVLLGDSKSAESVVAKYEASYPLDENLIRMKVKSGLIDAETARELKAQLLEKRDGASKQNEAQLPQEYSLSQNYPNPFNPTTTIRFALPELSAVSIKVFNVSGQLVKEIVAGDLQAGTHKIAFNGSDLSSGVYLYKFTAQSRESEKSYAKINRMVLVK